jgi:hypothetical protein
MKPSIIFRNKKCRKCGKIKNVKLFYKNNRSLNGLNSQCIDCVRLTRSTPEYRQRNAERTRIKIKNIPWLTSYLCAKGRCVYKTTENYNRYGGRGIKFYLTKEECAFLWNRDKADKQKKPSLDRINNDGNYELNNCRFIELSKNSSNGAKMVWRRKK